jgi:hypothetical protein
MYIDVEREDDMRTRHIPASGEASGLQGVAYCGRWAHYRTGDHESIRRAYRDERNREGACKHCLAEMDRQSKAVR